MKRVVALLLSILMLCSTPLEMLASQGLNMPMSTESETEAATEDESIESTEVIKEPEVEPEGETVESTEVIEEPEVEPEMETEGETVESTEVIKEPEVEPETETEAETVESTEVVEEPEMVAEDELVEKAEEVTKDEFEQNTETIFGIGLMNFEVVYETIDDATEVYEFEALKDISMFSTVYNNEWDKYSTNYHYNQLDSDWKVCWDALDALCLSYLTSTDAIPSDGMTYIELPEVVEASDAVNFVFAFAYSNPQYYFLLNKVGYATNSSGSEMYLKLFAYDAFLDGTARQTATASVKTQVDTMVAEINACETDAQKVQKANDLICNKIDYHDDIVVGGITSEEEQSAFTQSAYSTFCLDKTVCAGYADAMTMLCNAAGVDAMSVTSADHQWNKVRIDDTWYNVDATWADQNAGIYYQYFFRSDDFYAADNASHIEESCWEGVSPACVVDVAPESAWVAPGICPTISNTVATPVITESDGVVTISTTTANAEIYYTLDGTNPAAASAKAHRYKEAFQVAEACEIRAIAVCNTYFDSAVATYEFTLSEEDDNEMPTGTLGNNGGFQWTYDASTKTLTVTGEDIGLSLANLPSSVSEAEHYIFRDCKFSGSLASLFYNNRVVKSIDFINCDTSNVVNMQFMFSLCESLTSLDVSSFDTSNVTNMNSMFNGCSSLTEINVSNFDTSNVTGMGSMFYGCRNLTTLDVSNFNTSNVTYMEYMFENCKKLTSLDVSNFDTTNVTSMSHMFTGCSSLKSLDVSNFDTSNVIMNTLGLYSGMDYMFYGCSSVTSLDLSNFDISNLTELSGIFTGCTNLQTIHTPQKMSSTVMIELPSSYCTPTGKVITECTAEHSGIILTLCPIDQKYTITYELNGGKNNSSNPTSYYITTETITLQSPTRKGHTFAGWYSDSSYNTKVTQITKGSTGNKTFYAKWTANKYNIAFNGNGSTSGTMSSLTNRSYGTSYTLTTNAFKKTGYKFTGWNTKADGSGTTYANKASVKNLSSKNKATVTLYAQWQKVKYTVTYELNGGKNSSSNPTSYYVTTATKTLQNPTRKGYTFAGWYSDSKYKTKVTQIKKGSTGNKTLYAKWTAHKYNIAFNGNGATSGKMTTLTSRSYGKSYTLTTNAFKKTGYKFTGWNTKADGSGTTYANKASVKNLSSKNKATVTLYAQWKKVKYTVTYELNGGTNNKNNPTSYYVTTATKTLQNPTRKGYTFGGWYSDSKYKTKVTQIKKGSTGNKTLYAKWTANKYSIAFNGNGATSGKMTTLTSRSYGKSYTLTTNAFKKTGYKFIGWNTKADGSGTTYANKASVKNLSSKNKATVTLYAQWQKVKYTVTYELNGGTNNKNNPTSYYVTTATKTLQNPTRKGYTFGGWYSDSKYKTKVTQIKKGSTGNKTLYAKWTANKYSIAFNGNGATSGKMNTLTSRSYGKSYTLTANAYKRTGYKFTGWNTKADGSGKTYANKASVKNLSSKNGATVTLYAQWQKVKYTISYELNGGTNNSSNPTSYYVTTETITLKSPTKTGYTFNGWYSDSAFKNRVTRIEKGSTGNKKFYAKWTANSYNISFVGNGSTSGIMLPMVNKEYGTSHTLTANAYKKTGYQFTGWNTKVDGSGTAYADKADVKNLSETNGATVILYAQWQITDTDSAE